MNMWTYLIGPIVAIFPKPWRARLPYTDEVQWGRATALSGLAEAILALAALMRWYAYSMAIWVGNGTAGALSGKMGPEVRVQDIGAAALFVWATHPVTWLLGYAGLEGAFRLCTGAFAGNSCGSLLFFMIDKIVFSPFRRGKRVPAETANTPSHISSYTGAIRERMRTATQSEVADEICITKEKDGEILEIHACRRKQDWTPPRVVRYLDSYYRLEEDSSITGARPFRYRLRRLPAGVPGRTVLLYAPLDAVVRSTISC
jgi:hypothetical protein